MAIKIDWNSVEDTQEFTPIPEGEYVALIDSVEEKESKNGDPMWLVKFVIQEESYKNRNVLCNLVFTEKGLGNVKKLYSAIYGTKLPKSCETSDLIGEKVIIDVIITEYNGKKYNNVAYAGFKECESEEIPF